MPIGLVGLGVTTNADNQVFQMAGAAAIPAQSTGICIISTFGSAAVGMAAVAAINDGVNNYTPVNQVQTEAIPPGYPYGWVYCDAEIWYCPNCAANPSPVFTVTMSAYANPGDDDVLTVFCAGVATGMKLASYDTGSQAGYNGLVAGQVSLPVAVSTQQGYELLIGVASIFDNPSDPSFGTPGGWNTWVQILDSWRGEADFHIDYMITSAPGGYTYNPYIGAPGSYPPNSGDSRAPSTMISAFMGLTGQGFGQVVG